ncbi:MULTISPECIES: D-alanine--D-alanine ligase family protein [Micrococcaceae]|uniref:D-alanine--D-alanine ligase family protein n=1 Tax=unclassified Kocuria TaxID=2649579 RepID=UPI001012504E|nr:MULTISPECIES: D-alanine--D-alanine ligase family protein [unclassified Kocuria]
MTTTASTGRTTVGILFGGVSSEHSISLITAKGVLGVLDHEKYEPVLIGITPEGTWHLSSEEELNKLMDGVVLPRFSGEGPRVSLPMGDSNQGMYLKYDDGTFGEGPHLDVVFPLLHGPFGEDGTVQGLLELANLRYVGAGVTSSAVGMDKHFMKVAFESAGLEVGPYRVISARDWVNDRQASLRKIQELALPVFVKPARAGSSCGITRVADWADLEEAIDQAQALDPKIVVEEEISGREIECAVLDGFRHELPQASHPGEIEMVGDDHAFYDFEAKYVETASSELRCPADLPQEVRESIREKAVQAFLALDGEGLSRCDFFYTDDGRVVINEVNTMPGFTPISMYGMMWAESGIDYGQLVDRLIRLALDRTPGLR